MKNQYPKEISPKVNILGVPVNNVNKKEVISIIEKYIIQNTKPHSVFTPNVDHLIKLRKDKIFIDAYNDCDLIIADGAPLIWASKFLGNPLKEKVSGSDLLPSLCEVSSYRGYKLFFLGASQGIAQKAKEILQKKYQDLQIVGVYSPPYGFERNKKLNRKIIKMIKFARPDILFVALGAPKQEKWIHRYKDQYQVPVSIGIGGTFDFISGNVIRAPKWFSKIGIEWLWRLLSEPKRLWKRYLVDDPPFFYYLLLQKYKDSRK